MRLLLASLAVVLACGSAAQSPQDSGPGPDIAPPTAPSQLAAALAAPNDVRLAWSESTDDRGVAGYRVFRDGTQVWSGAECEATDTGLPSATTACYTVDAFDAAGNSSGAAGPVCIVTGDGVAPAAPAGVSASLTGPVAAALSWAPSTDDLGVIAYRVYRDGALQATTAGLAFAEEGLAPVSRHCYAVAAVDAAGNESPHSAPEACVTTLWRVETVTCVQQGYTVGEPDFAFDSQGFIQATFRGGNASLDYATNRSGAWFWSLVKQGTTEAISSPHIALDASDKAHIAYYSWMDFVTETKDLKYATNKDGDWTDAPVDTAGNVGEPNSIAVGADGKVHISYADLTNNMLKYARGVPPAWTVGSVDAIPSGGRQNVIAVSPSGEAHVLYSSLGYPYAIKHALLGVTPDISVVTNSTMLGNPPLLAFGASGAPWVGWRGDALDYASLQGSTWTGGSTGIPGVASLMEFDAAGKLHFYGSSNYFPPEYPDGVLAVLHQTNAGGAWAQNISAVDFESNAYQVAIRVAPDGALHAMYVTTAGTCIKHATNR